MKQTTARATAKEAEGFSVFAGYLPSVDRWLARRAAVKGLAAAADMLDRKAAEWEKRGHWQMAGSLKERAAKMAERSLDLEFDRDTKRRRDALLREAVVCYAVEIGDAARYDPAVQFRMYMVAKRMGEIGIAEKNKACAMKGFNNMMADRNLDTLVSLNRLKRQFLFLLWEGEMADALSAAREAVETAGAIRSTDGKTDRAKDTEAWVEKMVSERFGRD